ncbi:MAG: PDZ domain-containing protein [Actinomycetes bacterium]
MPWKTPNPGSEWANGENPEPPGGESEPARAWMHPSELGQRFDAGSSKDLASENTHRSPDGYGDQSDRESRGGFVGRVAVSCAALSIALGVIALGTYASLRTSLPTSLRSDRAPQRESASESRSGTSVKVGDDQGGRGASLASSIAAVQIHKGEDVSTISGICVKGGIVTASDSVSQDGVQLTGAQITVEQMTLARESLQEDNQKDSQTATQHAVNVSSVDEVSGLAYLTGYRCPESQLSMEQAKRWRSGEALLIAARRDKEVLSAQVRAQVFSEGGVLANTQFGRTGDAVLTPMLGAGSKHSGSATDSSAIGAALVNSSGEFMGVVIAEVNGSYLAIPSSMARRVISQFINGEKVEAGWLGLELDTDSKVLAVSPGSPAQAAGILVGEQIYATDGTRTAGVEALLASIQAHAPGDRLSLTIEHQGRTREVPVVLGSRAADEGS